VNPYTQTTLVALCAVLVLLVFSARDTLRFYQLDDLVQTTMAFSLLVILAILLLFWSLLVVPITALW